MDEDPQASSLGEMIRKQRELASLTMRQLSKMAGISNPYLSQIEHGLREPSQAVLREIATSLGIDPDELQPEAEEIGVRDAIAADPGLTAAQRRALTEVYTSMIAATAARRADRNS
ncbi:helix-turn-helix domain-containing protein [Epidermidibacterium keratini]|uniref:helix-turn-helix domain-containing protein n=1 Tax=Epidermidibacterium keratini TaxID=1891644 RepID=UPI001CEFA8C9|nr:helix-turn-helix transcriptional regulator [Epidermidibacterium keratini]